MYPSLRLVYHLFGKFKSSLSGDKMWALVEELENTLPGVRVAFQRGVPEEDKEMGIAILTPLMSRVHTSVPQAAEILFVETTGHIDMLNTSVTVLLTWSPTGSVPLGILLTDSLTERAYKQGVWQS